MPKITIQEAFEAYHAKNPEIFKLYCRFTTELLRRGYRRISPRFVMERIRWEKMISTVPTPGSGYHVSASKPFKINNNFSSRYARLLIDKVPDLDKVFETRALKAP